MSPSITSSIADPTAVPPGSIRHLTQLDLARRWRLSPRTLERWRWLGQGPAYLKLGNAIAYRLEDVEAFEVTRRHAGTRDSAPQASR
jgi:hypothetical protein